METIDNTRVENDREHETVADIAAVLRRYVLPSLAERLEAAWKREKASAESDALAVGGIVEAARTTEKSSAVGNAAALREALVQCELFLGNVSRHGHPTLNPGDKCTACNVVDELRGMVVHALAEPPRQCDVGTAKEQADRFLRFCRISKPRVATCDECPFANTNAALCEFAWAQMPYAEEGGAK